MFYLSPRCSKGLCTCLLSLFLVLRSSLLSSGPSSQPFPGSRLWGCAKSWMLCSSMHTGCLLAALVSATHRVPPGPENGRFVSYGLLQKVSQPVGACSIHLPSCFLLKWVGWSLRIQICYAYKTTLCPLEKCCVRLRAFPSPDFLVLMCSPPAKASLREGSLVIISKRCLSPPPSPAFQLFSLALLGTNMSVCLL